MNEKNLTHGRVTATISKFSPQIFETYISVTYDQSDMARLEISLNGAHNALRSQENVAGVTMCEVRQEVHSNNNSMATLECIEFKNSIFRVSLLIFEFWVSGFGFCV